MAINRDADIARRARLRLEYQRKMDAARPLPHAPNIVKGRGRIPPGAAAVLERHKDLAGLACVEAAGGVGAATAVRERGLVGKVRIVAMDRGNDILGLIGEGVIDATIAQQTALMPFYAVQILYNYQNRNVPIAEDNAKAGIRGVPPVVDTGVIVVDRSNYALFLRK